MTRWPAESRVRYQKAEGPEIPRPDYAGPLEAHHVFSRAQMGKTDWILDTETGELIPNLVWLPPERHRLLTENKARIWLDHYEEGWEYRWQRRIGLDQFEDEGVIELAYPGLELGLRPHSQAALSEGVSEAATGRDDGPTPAPSESADHDCEAVCTCGKKLTARVKRSREKKAGSPESKQLNFGYGPAEEVERLKERLNDLVEAAGLTEKPYARFKALDLALVLVEISCTPEALREAAEGIPWAA